MNPIAQWQEWQDFIIHRVEHHGHLQVPDKGEAPANQAGLSSFAGDFFLHLVAAFYACAGIGETPLLQQENATTAKVFPLDTRYR
jgi:hypothetical protein